MNKHISDAKKEQILQRSEIVSIIGEYVDLKKNGSSFFGKCPFHEEKDASFSVSPSKQFYYCFGCGEGGDVIEFLMKFNKLTFTQSLKLLADKAGVSITDGDLVALDEDYKKKTPPPRREKPEFVPATPPAPADLWRLRAEKFVAWAAENLAKEPDQLAWLAARGISTDTAARCRLGWNPGENGKDLYRPRSIWGLPEQLRDDGRPKALCIPRGLVIPCIAGGAIVRIRIRRPEAHRTDAWPTPYHFLPGSSSATMVLEPERRAFVIVESELDAIAVAAGNTLAGAVALGTAKGKPDAAAFALLKDAVQILDALDYDAAGAGALAWWAENFRNHARWPVPMGKDPGEAIKLGMAVEQWIRAGLPPALTIVVPAPRHADPEVRHAEPEIRQPEPDPVRFKLAPEIPAAVQELLALLRKNPGVKIANTPGRYTVLRDGRFVGGRIGELVLRDPAVIDYIAGHPAAEIDGTNLILGG